MLLMYGFATCLINGLINKYQHRFIFKHSVHYRKFIRIYPRLIYGVLTKLYADDLKLYTSLISTDDSHNLQDVLSNLLVWSKDWPLEVNVSKYHVPHLHKN